MNIHHLAFLCNEGVLSSIPFALPRVMSRVEPKEEPKREAKDDRHPSQAEGEERDVDEALRREEKRPED